MTPIREVFAGAGLTPTERVRWGAPVTTGLPGVYAVAATDDVEAGMGLADCPLDPAALRRLLQERPAACVDGVPATEASLAGSAAVDRAVGQCAAERPRLADLAVQAEQLDQRPAVARSLIDTGEVDKFGQARDLRVSASNPPSPRAYLTLEQRRRGLRPADIVIARKN